MMALQPATVLVPEQVFCELSTFFMVIYIVLSFWFGHVFVPPGEQES